MSELEELEETRSVLKKEVRELDERIRVLARAEAEQKNKKYLGKCFKHRAVIKGNLGNGETGSPVVFSSIFKVVDIEDGSILADIVVRKEYVLRRTRVFEYELKDEISLEEYEAEDKRVRRELKK